MELLVLLLMGGVILGPRRVAELARELGKLVRQIQNITRSLTKELNREIDLLDYTERKGSQRENHPRSGEDTTQGEGSRKAALPEAYQRFREDFPDEAVLEDDSPEEDSPILFVPSANRTNGEGDKSG